MEYYYYYCVFLLLTFWISSLILLISYYRQDCTKSSINIGHIIHDPADNERKLNCVPLLLIRDEDSILLPEDDEEIKAFDRILFCGSRDIKLTMGWTLEVRRSLNYVMTLQDEPEAYLWRKLHRYLNKLERRKTPR